MAKKSEFGRGFVYSLVLFAKHFEGAYKWQDGYAEMRRESKNKGLFTADSAYGLWFNGAGDHFYEFTIPKKFQKTKLGKLAANLQQRALAYRLKDCSENEFLVFWLDLEKLTRLIDKELGLTDIKAQYN